MFAHKTMHASIICRDKNRENIREFYAFPYSIEIKFECHSMDPFNCARFGDHRLVRSFVGDSMCGMKITEMFH